MPDIVQLPYDEKAILSKDKNELAKYLFSLVTQLKKELGAKTDNEADSIVTGAHRFVGDITAGIAGIDTLTLTNALAVASGGTGLSSYTIGDLLYASAVGVLSKLAIGSANEKLFVNAAGTLPEWDSGVYAGSFIRDMSVAAGNQSIDGVGFKPSIIFIISLVNGAAGKMSIGFDTLADHLVLYDNHNAVASTWRFSNSNCSLITDGTNVHNGELFSLDADGFTIVWSKTLNPTGTLGNLYFVLR